MLSKHLGKLLTIGSLFAGIGGFELGLERTGGFTTAWQCEIDKYCLAVLEKHWPTATRFTDITTLTKPPYVDVLCGGFPCQDISVAGKGKGIEGSRSGLWKQYKRIIEEVRPRYVIAENVSILRSRGLDVVLQDLHEIGYDAEWHCIPASYVGAPHQRDRIWIVAYPQYSGFQGWNAKGEGTDATLSPGAPLAYTDSNPGITRRPCDSCKGSGRWDVDGGSFSPHVANTCSKPEYDLLDRGSTQGSQATAPAEALDADDETCGKFTGEDYWSVEPNVGRVANGVPSRVDRIKCLGNAIVPQVATLIGHWILAREANG